MEHQWCSLATSSQTRPNWEQALPCWELTCIQKPPRGPRHSPRGPCLLMPPTSRARRRECSLAVQGCVQHQRYLVLFAGFMLQVSSLPSGLLLFGASDGQCCSWRQLCVHAGFASVSSVCYFTAEVRAAFIAACEHASLTAAVHKRQV